VIILLGKAPRIIKLETGAGILKSLWGLGTEEEEGYLTGPPGYMAGGIHSLESIPGPHTRLKIRALATVNL
jgi:hypothetical protein